MSTTENNDYIIKTYSCLRCGHIFENRKQNGDFVKIPKCPKCSSINTKFMSGMRSLH